MRPSNDLDFYEWMAQIEAQEENQQLEAEFWAEEEYETYFLNDDESEALADDYARRYRESEDK